MRRHGWGGRLPSTDDEAVERIVATARELIVERPDVPPSISEVAERLSITRQTVYRYVPSASALLAGAVQELAARESLQAEAIARLQGERAAADRRQARVEQELAELRALVDGLRRERR